MTAQAFALFGALTQAQQLRTWEIWHDPTEPTLFVYEVMGDQVVGRAPVTDDHPGATFSSEFQRPPAAPLPVDTVNSSRVDPKPISTRDVLHELPKSITPLNMGAARPIQEIRHRRAAAPQPKPKPRRRRSLYTRADVMRGLLFMVILVSVWISAAH